MILFFLLLSPGIRVFLRIAFVFTLSICIISYSRGLGETRQGVTGVLVPLRLWVT